MYKFLLFLFTPMLFAQTSGNLPPLIQNIEVTQSPFHQNSYYLEVAVFDAENDPLRYTCYSDSNALNIFADGSNYIRIDVNPGTRRAVVTVSVTDDHHGEATRTWDFLGSNTPPTIYKYYPSNGFLAQNNSSGWLSANIWDDDGDRIRYNYSKEESETGLVQIGHPTLTGTLLQSRLSYHASLRGYVDFSLEVSDPDGATATGKFRVQAGKILRRKTLYYLGNHGVSPIATDLDADGNLFAVSPSPARNFVLIDQDGAVLNSGSFPGVGPIFSITVQKHLPTQPLFLGTQGQPSNLASYSYDGTALLSDLGFGPAVLFAAQHPDRSTYICFHEQNTVGIVKRNTDGTYSDVIPGGLPGGGQISFNPYNGDFYMAMNNGRMVSAYTGNGTFIRSYPAPDYPYSQVQGVFADPQEKAVFVADTQNNRILVFDMDTGVHYQTYQGNLYFTPRFIHKFPNGTLAVGNLSNSSIEIFTYE